MRLTDGPDVRREPGASLTRAAVSARASASLAAAGGLRVAVAPAPRGPNPSARVAWRPRRAAAIAARNERCDRRRSYSAAFDLTFWASACALFRSDRARARSCSARRRSASPWARSFVSSVSSRPIRSASSVVRRAASRTAWLDSRSRVVIACKASSSVETCSVSRSSARSLRPPPQHGFVFTGGARAGGFGGLEDRWQLDQDLAHDPSASIAGRWSIVAHEAGDPIPVRLELGDRLQHARRRDRRAEAGEQVPEVLPSRTRRTPGSTSRSAYFVPDGPGRRTTGTPWATATIVRCMLGHHGLRAGDDAGKGER